MEGQHWLGEREGSLYQCNWFQRSVGVDEGIDCIGGPPKYEVQSWLCLNEVQKIDSAASDGQVNFQNTWSFNNAQNGTSLGLLDKMKVNICPATLKLCTLTKGLRGTRVFSLSLPACVNNRDARIWVPTTRRPTTHRTQLEAERRQAFATPQPKWYIDPLASEWYRSWLRKNVCKYLPHRAALDRFRAPIVFRTLRREALSLLSAMESSFEGSDRGVGCSSSEIEPRGFGTPLAAQQKWKVFPRQEKLPNTATLLLISCLQPWNASTLSF